MRRNRCIIILAVLFFPVFSFGQNEDTVLTFQQYVWYIKKYHPVVAQADLLVQGSESVTRSAKGGFDPYIQGSVDQKQYDDKKYYNYTNAGLKVPTWFGVTVKSGIDNNSGTFLNPENANPSNGLWYAGISVPLGQGLLIDERRAALKKAQVYAKFTVAQKQKMVNDLLFDAVKEFWKWTQAHQKLKIYEDAVQLASQRFLGVKRSFILGDKPAIDTLEAFIQLQNREISLNQATIKYRECRLMVSNYLWFENNTPLEIGNNLIPAQFISAAQFEPLSELTLKSMLNELAASHPEMQLYDFKLDNLTIEKKLKAEKLKPKLDVSCNALTEPIGNQTWGNLSSENYKFGASLSFPLFLRKERGDLQLTKFKIQEAELGQQQKLLKLQNKLSAYFNEQQLLNEQLKMVQQSVDNYERLLSAEKQKFNIGESSLFLVNSRENKLIEAQLKLVALKGKFLVANYGVIWAQGLLPSKNL